MNHYSEAELSWHTLESDPAIEKHVASCAECARRLVFVRRTDAGLADGASWQYPTDLRGTADARLQTLEAIEARLATEITDAKEHLATLIPNSMAFIWADVARKPRFQTAGAARVLCEAAFEYLERDSLHARNLAESALSIARGLGELHYLGKKVYQLIGRALKEKADAHRYLGEWVDGIAALDEARRAYDRAGVTPWEYGVLLYVRGVIHFRQGRLDDSEHAARDAAKLFRMSGDGTRRLYARLLIASLSWIRYDFRRARDEYASVLADIDPAKEELLAARVSANIANCDLDLGNTPAAEPVLLAVMQTYARFGLLTEVARFRWALARVPLVEGRVAEAIPLLRASKAELEHLNQRNDAALAALDLAEAVLATKQGVQEVRRLCSQLVTAFKAAGMVTEALTAVGYLLDASRSGRITSAKVRHVRCFLERLELLPELAFTAPRD